MLTVTSRGVPETLINSIVDSLNKDLGVAQIVTQSLLVKSDIHIEMDYDNSNNILLGDFNILILAEPKTVIPSQYRKSILNKFNLVIPISEIRANKIGCGDWAPLPYDFKLKGFNEILRLEKVVMINSAKFSANKSSLYGLRRKVSKRLNILNIGYKLVGDNWHMPKRKELQERIWAVRKEISAGNFPDFKEAFSNIFYRYPEYIGRVDDKFLELSKYKYALIIENEADYLSEKLFDAISAGCVPIYIGYNLSSFEKLSRCVIEIEPNVDEIINFFEGDKDALYKEKKDYIDNFENYINEINIFSLKSSAGKISKIIAKSFRNK